MNIKVTVPLLIVAVLLLLSCTTSVAANFNIVPTNVTQAEGLVAVFLCRHNTSRLFGWEVNGTPELDIDSSNINSDTKTSEDGGSQIRRLSITAIELYNGTVVECVAATANGFERTEPVTLTIQGRLDPVGSINTNVTTSETSSTLSVCWDAPFSLDITDTEPDITYCVDIYSIFDGSLVRSVCNLNDTEYTFSLNNLTGRTCDNFNITVTPVNGAGNGTSSGAIFETLGAINMLGGDLTVTDCMSSNYQTVLEITIEGSVNTCNCQVEIDGQTFNEMSGLVCQSSTLTLTTSQLPVANFYHVTVTLSNSAGSINATDEISTSIIENINTSSGSNNTVELMTTFANNTCINSTDFFVILAYLTPEPDTTISLNQSVYTLTQGTGSTSINDVNPGRYTVLVYDLGSDGQLRSRSPVTPITMDTVDVFGTTQTNNSFPPDGTLSLTVQQRNDTLTITCTPQQQQTPAASNCLVIIQLVGTLDQFQQLNLYSVENGGSPLLVQLDREGSFRISAYPLTENGLVGSSLAHAQTVLVQFTLPITTSPPPSTSSTLSTVTTDTEPTDSPSAGGAGGSTLPLIIGVVVGVLLLIIFVIVITVAIVVLVVCLVVGYKSGKPRTTHTFGHSEESTIRRLLVESPDVPVANIIASDGTEEIEMAPPTYNDVTRGSGDPMYDSIVVVPDSKSKVAITNPNPNGHGISPEALEESRLTEHSEDATAITIERDPNYDSVSPVLQDRSTTPTPVAAAGQNDGERVSEGGGVIEIADPNYDTVSPLVTSRARRAAPSVPLNSSVQETVAGSSDPNYDSVSAPGITLSSSGQASGSTSGGGVPQTDPNYDSVSFPVTKRGRGRGRKSSSNKKRGVEGHERRSNKNALQLCCVAGEEEDKAANNDHRRVPAPIAERFYTEEEGIHHVSGPATGEQYAVVDKTRMTKSEENVIQHVLGPDTGEPYAVVDKSQQKSQTIQHVAAPETGDTYAVVDKPKKTGAGGATKDQDEGPPLPPSVADTDREGELPSLPPPFSSEAHGAAVSSEATDEQQQQQSEDVDHMYDNLGPPASSAVTVESRAPRPANTVQYEAVTLETNASEEMPRKPNRVEYSNIVLRPEDVESSAVGVTLPGQPDESSKNSHNYENAEVKVNLGEANTPDDDNNITEPQHDDTESTEGDDVNIQVETNTESLLAPAEMAESDKNDDYLQSVL